MTDFQRYATGHRGIPTTTLDAYLRQPLPQSLRPDLHSLTPYIVEERPLNVAMMDVFSRLMHDRIIFLGQAVDDQVANIVNAQLLYLESVDARRDIYLYINSPGGSVYAGLGMYDVMQYVAPDINTVCTGMAASFGAVLLAAGTAGKRSALPHARIMIHQPHGGVQGQARDMEIMVEQYLMLKRELEDILARHTGQPWERIHADSDRDHWLRADEARTYGLIDEVLERKPV